MSIDAAEPHPVADVFGVRRSIRSVEVLAEFGAARGVPAVDVVAGTGIVAGELNEPAAEIEARQELGVVRNLIEHLGADAGLGVAAGVEYHVTTYGIWGFALISSPTLRDAIELGLRYVGLTFAFCRARLEDGPGCVELVLDDAHIPTDVRRFLVERDAAAIVTLGRELFAVSEPVADIRFRFPAPRPGARHASMFEVLGPSVEFDADRNSLRIDRAWLDQPLPQANASTAALLEEQCRALLETRRARHGLAQQVRNHVVHATGRIPSAATVAAELGVSPRTMRRRLAAEGTNFQQLVDEVRRALAEEMLSTPGISVAEIADRLGYAEPSSFIHAFRRWTQTTPAAFRGQRS